jgi:hypothetical protein
MGANRILVVFTCISGKPRKQGPSVALLGEKGTPPGERARDHALLRAAAVWVVPACRSSQNAKTSRALAFGRRARLSGFLLLLFERQAASSRTSDSASDLLAGVRGRLLLAREAIALAARRKMLQATSA